MKKWKCGVMMILQLKVSELINNNKVTLLVDTNPLGEWKWGQASQLHKIIK
ncbi:MAG: hypothetical protein KAX30_03830 [Candidatus Atribacteria bacterium]|nr:hypothetical protein [Candidatus Atribacteria bacterium]